jgi:hypothetical protein
MLLNILLVDDVVNFQTTSIKKDVILQKCPLKIVKESIVLSLNYYIWLKPDLPQSSFLPYFRLCYAAMAFPKLLFNNRTELNTQLNTCLSKH